MFSWKHSFNHIIAQGACAARSAVARRELPGCCGWYVFVLCLPRARPVFAPVCGLTPPALMCPCSVLCRGLLSLGFGWRRLLSVGCRWRRGRKIVCCGARAAGHWQAGPAAVVGNGTHACCAMCALFTHVASRLRSGSCNCSTAYTRAPFALPVFTAQSSPDARCSSCEAQSHPVLVLCLQLSLRLMPVVPPVQRGLCRSVFFSMAASLGHAIVS